MYGCGTLPYDYFFSYPLGSRYFLIDSPCYLYMVFVRRVYKKWVIVFVIKVIPGCSPSLWRVRIYTRGSKAWQGKHRKGSLPTVLVDKVDAFRPLSWRNLCAKNRYLVWWFRSISLLTVVYRRVEVRFLIKITSCPSICTRKWNFMSVRNKSLRLCKTLYP